MVGFAEQDWRAIARAGEVTAIYMGKKSARYIQGRLMMHGAVGDTPVTLIENVSRPDQRIHAATLATRDGRVRGEDRQRDQRVEEADAARAAPRP